MRKADENRAEKYIKKHRQHKRWLAFALCISILTATGTLYVLNKPATAMTEDGAKNVGLVLETADNEFEQGLIEKMSENENGAGEGNNTEGTDEPSGEGSSEATSVLWEDIIEDIPDEEASTEASSDDSSVASSADSSDESDVESSEAASLASSDDSSESDSASSASSEKSGDETEKKVTEYKDVVLTARYVDENGEEIAEASEYKTGEADLSQSISDIDGYLYVNTTINGEEVLSIKELKETVTEESEEDQESQEDAASTESSTDEDVKVFEYTYYEASRADGSSFTIKEDATINFNYVAVNDREEFTYKNDEVTVNVKLSNPKALPKGVELIVTTIDKDTQGYNYDAYLDALNESASEIAKAGGESDIKSYDENNTMLFDIAFKLGNTEYEPKDGTVSVSISFNNKQISDTLGTDESDEVAIVHLPINEEIMQEVESTSEATDITAKDISVEVLTEGTVDLGNGSDKVSFETDSFSVYGAVRYASANTWVGDQQYQARNIVSMLGDATYFGVVANEYDGGNNHSEANIAVGKISNIQNYTVGNSTLVYTVLDSYMITVNKTVSGSPKKGTFYFALYSDKNGTDKISGSDFSISTDNTGAGSYSFDMAALQKNGEVYSHVYVYELDKEGGKPVLNGKTVGSYTVTYGNSSFDGISDSVNYFSDNYILDLNGYNPVNILQQVNGASVYYKTSDGSYAGVTYTGSGYTTQVYNGSFPVDISSMLSGADTVSQRLAYATDTSDVKVVNVVGTNKGYLQKDLTDKYFSPLLGGVSDNYAVNTGFNIGSETLLVINVDLTNVSEYTLDKIKVNSKGTGDWSTIANQIIVNPVRKDSKGDYVPYTGKLYTNIMSGTLVAPKANVTLYGSYSGTIIADAVNKCCEIHKITVRRFLDAAATVDVYNTSSNAEIISISADKYIDKKLATDKDTGKFTFTLGMYDPDTKSWKQIDTNITNEGSRIKADIYPDALGMVYGEASEASEHTYFFALTENDPTTTEYNIDSSAILIKIKYYDGGEKDPLYYRATRNEAWDNFLNGTTKYYDDSHRIKSNKDTDALKNVAFYNTSAETVDIEVTKAWVLNGRSSSDIPSNTDDVVLTLYKVSGGEAVDTGISPVVTKNSGSAVDGADATWKYRWDKLPKYDEDGNLITYVVAETKVPEGFSSDTTEYSPKIITFTQDGEYSNKKTHSTALGTTTVTNKGVSLKLTLFKYLDNQIPSEKFDFVIKRVYQSGNSTKWMGFDSAPLSNEGSEIGYTIDPSVWKMSPGNTYYFRITESAYKYDTNKDNPENSPYYANYKRDEGAVIAKIVYNSANDINITYYKIDKQAQKDISANASLTASYCTSEYEVSGDKVAFYNSTSDNITIKVTKVWDELVGRAKNDKAVADSIFDVTIRILRSEDGTNWETAEEYTIKTPDIWQESEGDDFKGELNDYPEDWTYSEEDGGYVSKPITFNNLSNKYQYKIQEFYVDGSGNYNELTVGGATVNGYKLESIKQRVDTAGNISYTLHNTPYIQIYKKWKFEGQDVSYEDTASYNPVYVKVYRNYRADKSYIQLTYDQLTAGSDSAIVHETAENGAVVELNYNNGWYAEFALDRKQDNEDGQSHVYQYVYLIKECDEYGNEFDESPYITYSSINTGNVTRTTADYNYTRGFKNKTRTDQTNWEEAWVSGNNYPVCILSVTNNRGTNVLPESGGIGDIPFKTAGITAIVIAFLGAFIFRMSGRKKKHSF